MAIEPVITVPYEEMDGSPKESSSNDSGLSATRVLRCAWDDRLTLVEQLMGGVVIIDGVRTWTLPAKYPYDPNGIARVVNTPQIMPEGKPVGNAVGVEQFMSYKYAIITVQYGTNQQSYTSPEDEYLISNDLAGSIQVLTVPGRGKYFWTEDVLPVDIDNAPVKQIQMLEWTRTIGQVDEVPLIALSSVGKVNETAIDYSDYAPGVESLTFAPETLLMLPVSMEDQFLPRGNILQRVTLRFMWMGGLTAVDVQGWDTAAGTNGGWNHAFRPGRSNPERMWISNSDRQEQSVHRAYELTDLKAVLDALK